MDETIKNYPIYIQTAYSNQCSPYPKSSSCSPLRDDSSGDSGHSSGSACSGSAHSASGNSSCDEIDVESIGSNENQKLEKPLSSSFSISNLLKEERKQTTIPTSQFHSMFTPIGLPFAHQFPPYDQNSLFRHWNPLLFPNTTFVRLSIISIHIFHYNKLYTLYLFNYFRPI